MLLVTESMPKYLAYLRWISRLGDAKFQGLAMPKPVTGNRVRKALGHQLEENSIRSGHLELPASSSEFVPRSLLEGG